MNFRSFSDMRKLILDNIPKLQKYDFDLVVGIPRSGMIPAYLIALYLNKSCCDINELISNMPLKNGLTRKVKKEMQYPFEAEKILLVDDSILSGFSLKNELDRIPKEILSKITTLALYSSKRNRSDIDLFFEYIPSPRLFEWNIFHHSVVESSCFDIDGVLCVDPTEEQNDDGKKYIDFIKNAQPLFIPTKKVKYIVTSRLEKYRVETEKWLKDNGIQYNSLVMLDLKSKQERQKLNAHSLHKANFYKESDCDLFFESDRSQAIKIHELTKKPVYCVDTNEMFSKGTIISAMVGTKNAKKEFIVNLLRGLPKPLYNSLRLFYRIIK